MEGRGGPPSPMGSPTSASPRLLVGGLASSVGKTTVVAGILGALRRRGYTVGAYKCGPDFLDPQVLGEAAGAPARNLDPWLVPPPRFQDAFFRSAPVGDRAVSVVEGVMGVLDGSSWGTSASDVARLLRLPIVLVLDVSATSETVVLQARGARSVLGPRLAGVILNRAGEGWHARTVQSSVERGARVPVLGVLPWDSEVLLPERHLGLRTSITDPGSSVHRHLSRAAAMTEASLDLDALLRIARSAPSPAGRGRGPVSTRKPTPGPCRVAVAHDAAFCFLYPENLEEIERAGGEVVMFSPVRGDALPSGTHAIYLPGGYPELHAGRLQENRDLARELRAWVGGGWPLYAECGGMMFLLQRLVDGKGRRYRMAGAFPGSTRMSTRLGGLGYRLARARRKGPFGPRGSSVPGHVYHHSVRSVPAGQRWALDLRPLTGRSSEADGYLRGGSMASYLHVRFDTAPGLARQIFHLPNADPA